MSRVVSTSAVSVSRSAAAGGGTRSDRPTSAFGGGRSASSSSAGAIRRSRSAGVDSSIAFGRTESVTSARHWSSTAHVTGREPLTPHPLSHAINVDELAAVDVLSFGGPTGSVRLERYSPSGATRGAYIAPYSQRDPVTLTLAAGTVTVTLSSSGAVVCTIALDRLAKVEVDANGTLLLACQSGQVVTLSVHSRVKLAAMRKLIKARATGILASAAEGANAADPAKSWGNDSGAGAAPPAGPATAVVTASPRRPQLSALTPPLTRSLGDPLPRAVASDVIAAVSGVTGDAAATPGAKEPARASAGTPLAAASPAPATPQPQSAPAAAPTPVSATRDARDARRDVLYAQLRAAKEKRLGKV